MFNFVSFHIILCTIVTSESVQKNGFGTFIEWNYLNFTWQSREQQIDFNYTPGNDVIAGVKIYKNVIYFAVPRFKSQTRVTLASIPLDGPVKNPLLSPFPNWQMNTGNDCNTLQNVMSMEIDQNGIMWVIDGVRINNNTDCPGKIVLFDLERNGEIIDTFKVPLEFCSVEEKCFLNDIVVDGEFAYISVPTESDPCVLVFDRKNKDMWRLKSERMLGEKDAINFTAVGVTNDKVLPVNGIALSPDCYTNRTFFFMAQTSFHIHAINNAILKNEELCTADDVDSYIINMGTKQAQCGGMICDTSNHIYYGLLPLNAVGKWDVHRNLTSAVVFDKNDSIIRWPDSFSFDGKGNLYLITNSMAKFQAEGITNFTDTNFRLLKVQTDTNSYIYCR